MAKKLLYLRPKGTDMVMRSFGETVITLFGRICPILMMILWNGLQVLSEKDESRYSLIKKTMKNILKVMSALFTALLFLGSLVD